MNKRMKIVETSMYNSSMYQNVLKFLPEFCSFIQSHRYGDLYVHNRNWFNLVYDSTYGPWGLHMLNRVSSIVIIGDSTQSDIFHGLLCEIMRNGLQPTKIKNDDTGWTVVNFVGKKIMFKQQWTLYKEKDVLDIFNTTPPDVLFIHFGIHYRKHEIDSFYTHMDEFLEKIKAKTVFVRGSIPQHFPVYSGQFEEFDRKLWHDKDVQCTNSPKYGGKWREIILSELCEKYGHNYVSLDYLNDLPYLHPSNICVYRWPIMAWRNESKCRWSVDCSHVAIWTPWIYQPMFKSMVQML